MATFDSGKSLEKEVLQLFKLVQKNAYGTCERSTT